MPANQGRTSADWSPRPDFAAHGQPLTVDDSLQHYEPATVEECAAFFESVGFPDLDVYDGHPEVRADIAAYTARLLLTPGVPIVQSMERYRQDEADPAKRQDYEHDRQWQLLKIQKELERARQASGQVIEAAGRFALGSQLHLATGVVIHQTTAVASSRQLG
jgi:hypothetical protein